MRAIFVDHKLFFDNSSAETAFWYRTVGFEADATNPYPVAEGFATTFDPQKGALPQTVQALSRGGEK